MNTLLLFYLFFVSTLLHFSVMIYASDQLTSNTSNGNICTVGVNLLSTQETAWQVLSSLQQVPFWTMKKHIGALGDGITISMDDNNDAKTAQQNPFLQLHNQPIHLRQTLQCELPHTTRMGNNLDDDDGDAYDLEVTVSAKKVQQPLHSYLTFVAQPIFKEEDGEERKSGDMTKNDMTPLIEARIEPQQALGSFDMPYYNRITRVPLPLSSSRRGIHSFQFHLEFNDLIYYSPKNHISVVLLKRFDSASERFLRHHKTPTTFEKETALIPAKYSSQYAFQPGLVQDASSMLYKLHWLLMALPEAFNVSVEMKKATTTDTDTNDTDELFEISVQRTTPYIISSESSQKAYDLTNGLSLRSTHALLEAPAVLVTADCFIAHDEEYFTHNQKDLPFFVLSADFIALDREKPVPAYIGSSSSFLITADSFASIPTEEFQTVRDASSYVQISPAGRFRTFSWVVAVPPNSLTVTISLNISGNLTHLAHARNLKITALSFTSLTRKKAISIISICLISVGAFALFVALCVLLIYKRRQSRKVLTQTMANTPKDHISLNIAVEKRSANAEPSLLTPNSKAEA